MVGPLATRSHTLRCEPRADRTQCRAGSEVGREDDTEKGDDHEGGAGAGATEHVTHAVSDPASQGAGVVAEHPGESEEGDHRHRTADGRPRAGSPLGGQTETRPGEHEPGDADPGPRTERREEPVVQRARHRSPTREEEDRREDHARADRSDTGQLTAQVAMQQRRAR